MRILFVTHNYPRFAGDPAGAFVARIAQGVAASGSSVEVLAPHAPGVPDDERVDGVQVRRFRYGPEFMERVAYSGSLHSGRLRSPLIAAAFPGFLFGFRHAVHTAVRQFGPQLIHAHWWVPAGWLASGTSVPYVITCHGSDVRLLDRPLVRRLARPVFRKAARVTAVSNFLAQDIDRLLPHAGQPVQLTPMPVDIPTFAKGAQLEKVDPPRILYAGNLVTSKGVDVLLRAAALLSQRAVRYQLKVLGQGPAQRSLQELSAQLGIAAHVTWSPFVRQNQMAPEYGASTVTVLPTRGQSEGLGLTLVEALVAGSAVVGTPAGGIPEVVRHEETGLLSRPGDPGDMADQLQRLLENHELRARLTGAGKAYAEHIYSPQATVGRFLEIYRDVADD
jgi:glycosyltransferase involved in cell wall biosynthesis